MPASQTRSVSYRIGEAASGGMGAISQPANQSGPGQSSGTYLAANEAADELRSVFRFCGVDGKGHPQLIASAA